MAKIVIRGTEKWDGVYPAIQPSRMTLKAYSVLQIQSGMKSKAFNETMQTIGGQTALTVFGSLLAAGKDIEWQEVEGLTMEDFDLVQEPGDLAKATEASGKPTEDPTAARTDSDPGVAPAAEAENSLP